MNLVSQNGQLRSFSAENLGESAASGVAVSVIVLVEDLDDALIQESVYRKSMRFGERPRGHARSKDYRLGDSYFKKAKGNVESRSSKESATSINGPLQGVNRRAGVFGVGNISPNSPNVVRVLLCICRSLKGAKGAYVHAVLHNACYWMLLVININHEEQFQVLWLYV